MAPHVGFLPRFGAPFALTVPMMLFLHRGAP